MTEVAPDHPFPWRLLWGGGGPDIVDRYGKTVADPEAGHWFTDNDLAALIALTERAEGARA